MKRLAYLILLMLALCTCRKKEDNINPPICKIDSIVGLGFNFKAVFTYEGDSTCFVNTEPYSAVYKNRYLKFKSGKLSEQIIDYASNGISVKYEYLYNNELLTSIKLYNFYPDPMIPKLYLSADFTFQNNLLFKAQLKHWVNDTIYSQSSLSYHSKDGKNIDSCSKGFSYGFLYDIDYTKKNSFKNNYLFLVDPYIDAPSQFYDYCALLVNYFNENETPLMRRLESPNLLFLNKASQNPAGLIDSVQNRFYTRRYFYGCSQ